MIGRDGGLPWHLPADLRRFKALTLGEDGAGRPMVMGRRTFESFPAPLPGRRHIVLTRDRDWRADGAEVVHTIDDALTLAGADTFVIGGAEVFAAFAPLADRIELTEVHVDAIGDVRVPAFTGWHEAVREDRPAEGGRPAYSFVTLARD